MKKIWIIAGLLGFTVLALGAAGIVYAQSETPQPATPPGFGNGMMRGRGGYIAGEEGPHHDEMIEAFAKAIGLSPEVVETRLASGETMWQIVESEGVSMEEFGEIMSQIRSDFIQQALDDGILTQEQADFMAQRGSQGGTGGYGQEFGDCMGDVASGGFHHGHQGWRNTP
jgi:ABC-type glycerol-3-phosphate transport system substrate-binding protein